MLTGKHPFEITKEGKEDIFDIILSKDYDVTELDKSECSEEAKDIILKTLVKDPDKRLSTEECLNHPWIRKNITCRAGAITKKTMRILKRFSQKTPLQKELFFFIAKITREEEIKQLKEIFNQIDIKSEGKFRMMTKIIYVGTFKNL